MTTDEFNWKQHNDGATGVARRPHLRVSIVPPCHTLSLRVNVECSCQWASLQVITILCQCVWKCTWPCAISSRPAEQPFLYMPVIESFLTVSDRSSTALTSAHHSTFTRLDRILHDTDSTLFCQSFGVRSDNPPHWRGPGFYFNNLCIVSPWGSVRLRRKRINTMLFLVLNDKFAANPIPRLTVTDYLDIR